mgnify:CR=1 FL=1
MHPGTYTKRGRKAVDLLIEKDFQAALEKSNQINQFNETRKRPGQEHDRRSE